MSGLGETKRSQEFYNDLLSVLHEHKKWLDSNGKEGKQADLSQKDLSNSDLRGRNLSEAKLDGANLSGANLEGANLSRADLRGANLYLTRLFDAKLRGANLLNAKGLIASQLARADVSECALPKEIAEFDGIRQANEIAHFAQRLFTIMLIGCLYFVIIVVGTDDPMLLTNSSTIALPILTTTINVAFFFLSAPILLLGFFIYFHLYLQRLWEALYRLPAFLIDGRPLDLAVSPWLVVSQVRSQFPMLRTYPPPLTKIRIVLSALLAWYLVPFTIVCFWFRYLTRHDWTATIWHIILFIGGIMLGTTFHYLALDTLRGKPWKLWAGEVSEHKSSRPLFVSGSKLRIFLPICTAGLLIFASISVIKGTPTFTYLNPLTWLPAACKVVGYNVFADFSYRSVSPQPVELYPEYGLDVLTAGADLRRRDLRHANAFSAYLANANLTQADLRRADFQSADLKWAKLSDANMSGINLMDAILKNAKLDGAVLTGAVLTGANLQGADLRGADLSSVLGLTMDQLRKALTDSSTILPAGLLLNKVDTGKVGLP
jgi:uncharacterized protein YjbI with pentapeptide repeats